MRSLLVSLTAPALALGMMTAPVSAFDVTAMSPDERAAFGEAVRSYLMENPGVIIEAVNALEARQAEVQAQADVQLIVDNAEALFDDGYSWVGGNPEGSLTLVEFIDYRCGFCRRAHPEVEELVAGDGDIRFIVKEFPILGEASLLASRFAIATRLEAGDDAYKSVHDALIALNGEPSERSLRRMAETLDLDGDAILARLEDDAVTEQIRDTRDLARRLQINGTPAFVMGDELIRGFVPLAGMQEIAAEQRNGG